MLASYSNVELAFHHFQNTEKEKKQNNFKGNYSKYKYFRTHNKWIFKTMILLKCIMMFYILI